jgi:hypothetical protein
VEEEEEINEDGYDSDDKTSFQKPTTVKNPFQNPTDVDISFSINIYKESFSTTSNIETVVR